MNLNGVEAGKFDPSAFRPGQTERFQIWFCSFRKEKQGTGCDGGASPLSTELKFWGNANPNHSGVFEKVCPRNSAQARRTKTQCTRHTRVGACFVFRGARSVRTAHSSSRAQGTSTPGRAPRAPRAPPRCPRRARTGRRTRRAPPRRWPAAPAPRARSRRAQRPGTRRRARGCRGA